MQPLTHAARDRLLPLAARLARRGCPAEPGDTLLILQPDHLGDALLAQPAVRHIRAAFPDSRVVALVGPWSQRICELAWPVDEVRTLRFPGFERAQPSSRIAPYRLLRAAAHDLAPLRARAAVILRPDAWWAAALASFAAIASIVTADDPRAAPFATRCATLHRDDHAVIRALRIAQALTGAAPSTDISSRDEPLHLPLDDAAAETARHLLTAGGLDPRRGYLVIHPGAGVPVKHWPSHRWALVALAAQRAGLGVVLTGSTAERALVNEVANAVPGALNLAGQTSLDELIELLRGAALVAGPDCGPLHLAVATQTPTVHLFGPSDPLRYGPWGSPYNHLVLRAGWRCPRCGDLSGGRPAGCGCMLAITPESVLAAMRRLLGLDAAA